MISVIIPVYREGKNQIFRDALMLLSCFKNIEVLCIGKSIDQATKKIINQFPNASYFPSNMNTRAERLNDGLKLAKNDLVIFHHPRSRLTRKGLNYLINNYQSISWGAFTHQFDQNSFLYRIASWYSNIVRGKARGIFYLDHCLVVNLKKVAKQDCSFPKIDIFEDTEFCQHLSKLAKPSLIPFPSITSTIRFQTRGFWKQLLLNQALKIAYYLGISKKSINKLYEKEMELNSAY